MTEPGFSPARGADDAVEPPATASIQGANPFIGLNRQQIAAAMGRWGGRLMPRAHGAGLELGRTDGRAAPRAGRHLVDRTRSQGPPLHRPGMEEPGVAASGPVVPRLTPGRAGHGRRSRPRREEQPSGPGSPSCRSPRRWRPPTRWPATPPPSSGRPAPAASPWSRARATWSPTCATTAACRRRSTPDRSAWAATSPSRPGAVVYRSEVLELIQYRPTTPRCASRPVVIVPPQVNKYYFLDLAPGRSFVEHAVAQGHQTVFTISWRNPTAEQHDWSTSTPTSAPASTPLRWRRHHRRRRAQPDRFCAGGIAPSLLLAHLAATGRDLVGVDTFGVTTLDTDAKSSRTCSPAGAQRASSITPSGATRDARACSTARPGVRLGLRPNDLVWNYWVSNYLLGEDPPAFDVLAWNSDTTQLPAALHADFVHLFMTNRCCSRRDDLGARDARRPREVKSDLYVVGATTDHLMPWKAATPPPSSSAARASSCCRIRPHPEPRQPARQPEGELPDQ